MATLSIDPRTIVFLLALGNLIAAWLVYLYPFAEQRSRLYVASRVAQGLAWIPLALAGQMPFDLAYVAGTIPVLCGFAGEALALLSIGRRDTRLERFFAWFAAAIAATVLLNVLLDTSHNVRVAQSSFLVALTLAIPAWVLLRQAGGSALRRTLGAMYAVICVTSMLRGIDAYMYRDVYSLVTRSPTQVTTFVALFAQLVFGNVGYILLLKERKDHELQQAASTDPLTGIANRREFFTRAEFALSLAQRRREPATLLMLDLDHFKRINDTFGHGAGDAVLRTFAATVAPLIRPYDVFARLGGEEFAILLLGDAASAREIGERICQATAAQRLSAYPDLRFTVSIGAVTRVPTGAGEIDTLIHDADQALYAAKHAGRDRLVLAVDVAATSGSAC